MPFLHSPRRALPAAILLLSSIASAQECYYADGKTLSQDVVCDTTAADSACCPSNSFCLSGGLCVAGAVVSIGSCTDKTWGSAACAGYCKTASPNSETAITPCSTDIDVNTFACGLSGDCSADTFTVPADTTLSLRPNQIAALVGTLSSDSASASSAAAAEAGTFTTGALIGVGVGVGAPLLLALIVAIIMLRREKRRFSKPKLMYKLPDDMDESKGTIPIQGPPRGGPHAAMMHPAMRTESVADTASAYSSRRGSYRTAPTASPALRSPPPQFPPTFVQRYESMKKSASGPGDSNARHELESAPPYEIERHELGNYRRSVSSQMGSPPHR